MHSHGHGDYDYEIGSRFSIILIEKVLEIMDGWMYGWINVWVDVFLTVSYQEMFTYCGLQILVVAHHGLKGTFINSL